MSDKLEQIEQLLAELKTEKKTDKPQAEILSICNHRVIFKIPSSRDGYHFVTYTPEGWECTCEHHQYRSAICRHIKESKDLLFDFTTEVCANEDVLNPKE